MRVFGIDIRVERADELRAAWLDGFADGGLFVPGAWEIPAGAPVLLRIHVDHPAAATTVLEGTVVWRRLPQRGSTGASLRPGVGVSFPASMRPRVLYLDRLARGAATEARAAGRYPVDLPGELVACDAERPIGTRVLDVGVRGARVTVASRTFLQPGSAVELRVAPPRSGESARAPLVGRVAWVARAGAPDLSGVAPGSTVGVRLDLGTTHERIHWAKIVTRAREALEEASVRVASLAK